MDKEIIRRVKKALEESVGGLGDRANQMIEELVTEYEIVACAATRISKYIVDNC